MRVVIDPPRTADVVIVGGGFAGMATAWALRARGISDVLVVERESALGVYASGRAAGLGRQLAEDDATTALTVRGAELLRTKLAAAWQPTGGVLTFDNLDHARAYEERAARFGVPAFAMTRDLVLGHWPQLEGVEIAAALHVPSDGVLAVDVLLRELAVDVDVALSTQVTAIESLPGGARVRTPRGDIVARIVVDATGAWAGQLTGDAPLASYKRHVYLLDDLPTVGAPFVWHLGACEMYVRAAGSQIMASPCDGVLVPAGDQQPDAEGRRKMERVLVGSTLETRPIAKEWACQRSFTASGEMQLARDATRPWLVWAVGLGGHGATASAAVGETVARRVFDALRVTP